MTTTTFKRPVRTPYLDTRTTAFSVEANTVQANYLKAIQHFTQTITTETFEQKFERLSLNWKSDSLLSSSSHSLLTNPSYLGIIAMGNKVLPLIFENLKKEPDHWFMALSIITGANPVSEGIRGNVNAIANAWMKWGEENGYVT